MPRAPKRTTVLLIDVIDAIAPDLAAHDCSPQRFELLLTRLGWQLDEPAALLAALVERGRTMTADPAAGLRLGMEALLPALLVDKPDGELATMKTTCLPGWDDDLVVPTEQDDDDPDTKE